MPGVGRSRGSVLLAAQGDRKAIARTLDCAVSSVNGYCSGSQSPGVRMRDLICATWPHIDQPAWDEPAMLPKAVVLPTAADVDTGEAAGTMVRDLVRRTALQCRRVMVQLEQDTNADPSHVARQLDSLAATLAKLGKFTGQELTPRQILDSPHLRVIVRELLAALEPWPDAVRAAGEAMQKLTAGGD